MNRTAGILAACGAALGVSGLAVAQPTYVVNISGATLQANFFKSAASNNDFIDVDRDGNTSADPVPDNFGPQIGTLAFQDANGTSGPWGVEIIATTTRETFLHVNYASVGSGNGFADLVAHGRPVYLTDGQLTEDGSIDETNYQGQTHQSTGAVTIPALNNIDNPFGFPIRSTIDGTYRGAYFGDADVTGATFMNTAWANGPLDANHGIQIDIAPVDVPGSFFVTQSGTGSPTVAPSNPGYGNNDRLATDKSGVVLGQGNKLKSLTAGSQVRNLNASDPFPSTIPDENTIFDNFTAITPIAPIVNFGVGMETITQSSLRTLSATGRTATGENLIKVTRDSGSGTRNAFMNGICLDPSWGVGENIGAKNEDNEIEKIGDMYLPSNKGGSGTLEDTMLNTRLGVGHTGAERGFRSRNWLVNGRLDILGVEFDVLGLSGAGFIRPTISDVIDGDYRISGPNVFDTLGDPKAAYPCYGGNGCFADRNGDGITAVGDILDYLAEYSGGSPDADFNCDGILAVGDILDYLAAYSAGCAGFNTNPRMSNNWAAAYMNNTLNSLALFVDIPVGRPEAEFSPGEFLANNFVPFEGPDLVPPIDGSAQPCDFIVNTQKNANVATYLLGGANTVSPNNVLGNPEFYTFGIGDPRKAGDVPVRRSGTVYTDNNVGDQYVLQGTSANFPTGAVAYGSPMPLRNRVFGDFNADGLRNIDDLAEMLKAYNDRNGGAAWVSPVASGVLATDAGVLGETVFASDASIELLGDADHDGNFTLADVRYFADGLAIATGSSGAVAGQLDRRTGFAILDATSLSEGGSANFFGTTLAAGASYENGDSAADVAGNLPTRGWAPNGHDLNVDNLDIDYVRANFGDWSILTDAVAMDLSADMTGDLVVDQADVCWIVKCVLETRFGDVDLDGDVDADDLALATDLGSGALWADGDVDGDGDVDADDRAIISAEIATPNSTAINTGCGACPTTLP